jgi:hypothetical protein
LTRAPRARIGTCTKTEDYPLNLMVFTGLPQVRSVDLRAVGDRCGRRRGWPCGGVAAQEGWVAGACVCMSRLSPVSLRGDGWAVGGRGSVVRCARREWLHDRSGVLVSMCRCVVPVHLKDDVHTHTPMATVCPPSQDGWRDYYYSALEEVGDPLKAFKRWCNGEDVRPEALTRALPPGAPQ